MKNAKLSKGFMILVELVVIFGMGSNSFGQTIKQPRLFLIPFGGGSISYDYFIEPPSTYIRNEMGLGAYFGTLLEYKMNSNMSLITGIAKPLENTSYHVVGIVKSLVSSNNEEIPLLFRYQFYPVGRPNLYVQAGFSFNFRNKNDVIDTQVWVYPLNGGYLGTAIMTDQSYCINTFSFKAGIGIRKEITDFGELTLFFDYSLGFKEFTMSEVLYNYSYNNVWYHDKMGNRGDYIGLGLGYYIPLLKKYFYIFSDETYSNKSFSQKKKDLLPRIYFEARSSATMILNHASSTSDSKIVTTTIPISYCLEGLVEYKMTEQRSLIAGFNRNFRSIGFYVKTEIMDYGSLSFDNIMTEIPIAYRQYKPLSKTAKVFYQLGCNYIHMENRDFEGFSAATYPDTFRVDFTAKVLTPNSITTSAEIGVTKRFINKGELLISTSMNIGLLKMQHMHMDVNVNGTKSLADVWTRNHYFEVSAGLRFPIFRSMSHFDSQNI